MAAYSVIPANTSTVVECCWKASVNSVSRMIFVADPPFMRVEPVIGSGPYTGAMI